MICLQQPFHIQNQDLTPWSSLVTCIQGPSKPYADFTKRLKDAPESEEQVLSKQLAFDNAN